MTAAAGHPTLRLVRAAIGPLRLTELGLAPGAWRALRPDEERALRASAQAAPPARKAASRFRALGEGPGLGEEAEDQVTLRGVSRPARGRRRSPAGRAPPRAREARAPAPPRPRGRAREGSPPSPPRRAAARRAPRRGGRGRAPRGSPRRARRARRGSRRAPRRAAARCARGAATPRGRRRRRTRGARGPRRARPRGRPPRSTRACSCGSASGFEAPDSTKWRGPSSAPARTLGGAPALRGVGEHLVGDDRQPALAGEGAERLEILRVDEGARRVVRVDQQQRAAPRAEGARQHARVDAPARARRAAAAAGSARSRAPSRAARCSKSP